MGIVRLLFWLLGALLVIGALVLLFLQTGLASYIPLSMAALGLLILVGLLIMGIADRAGRNRTVVEHRDVPPGPAKANAPPQVIDPNVPSPEAGQTVYTGVARSKGYTADGQVVEGTVRTEKVVRRGRSGNRRLVYQRQTKTVVKRPPGARVRTRPQAGSGDRNQSRHS